jgi:hypothetical protein
MGVFSDYDHRKARKENLLAKLGSKKWFLIVIKITFLSDGFMSKM